MGHTTRLDALAESCSHLVQSVEAANLKTVSDVADAGAHNIPRAIHGIGGSTRAGASEIPREHIRMRPHTLCAVPHDSSANAERNGQDVAGCEGQSLVSRDVKGRVETLAAK